MTDIQAARKALEHYALSKVEVKSFGTGLINSTFLVTADGGRQYVLQALNSVFAPEINLDIDALTAHLDAKGVVTQRLIKTADSPPALWVVSGGRNWRLSTFVPGVCFEQLQTEKQSRAAGRLLGQFHRNVSDLRIELHARRLGVHDTARHLSVLRGALKDFTEHRYYSQITALGEAVLTEANNLSELPELPDRLVHGDPKISNLVFDAANGAGLAMIDLDTLAFMPLPLEMGDAFRSWCNPRGENTPRSQFRLDLFGAAVEGYAEVTHEIVTEQEWRAFVPATMTIMIELAARFTTDAFKESYFGWDSAAFADRSTHNQIRAAGQLELYHSLHAQKEEAEVLVVRAFMP